MGPGAVSILVAVVVVTLPLGLLGVIGRLPSGLQPRLALIALLGPVGLFLVVGLVLPALQTARWSLMGPDGREAVGLANFGWVLAPDGGRTSLLNGLLWILVVPIASVALGLGLAVLIDRLRRHSIPVGVLAAPLAISYVVAAAAWGAVLRTPTPTGWVPAQPWNTMVLMVIVVWMQSGLALVLLATALRALPGDVLEAARIDGADGWQLLLRVKLPMISDTVLVCLAAVALLAVQVFDIVRTTTNGALGTQVVANLMVGQAFERGEPGRGSALAVTLLLATLPLVAWWWSRLRASWEPR